MLRREVGVAMRRARLSPARLAAGVGLLGVAAVLWTGSLGMSQERAGDAVRGKMLFEKRCTGCHGLDQDKEGPRLRRVYGRKAGTVEGFPYSDALKGAQFAWKDAQLEEWLTDTESVLKNNNMEFHVPSAEERADIVAFLRDAAEEKP
ncbi:MAG: c-type cytochrome [Terracidiphilus sp.]